MSKPAKPAETGDLPPKKSKKMLIIIIAVVVLLAGGGAAAYFLMKPAHPAKHAQNKDATEAAAADDAAAEDDAEEEDAHEKTPPKYVELGTFTGKLVDDSADRYLQVAISVKLSKPELEEKVKERNPEIMHKINMLLQSKRPSELDSVEGKQILAGEIKAQVQYVLGLRHSAPAIHTNPLPAPSDETAQDSHAAPAHAEESHSKRGVEEILFTSFIIQ